MKKKLINLVIAAALTGGATIGHAASYNTFSPDGVLQNFSGIDWHSNGGGWIQGFDLTGANVAGDTDVFTLTYQAFAGVFSTTSPVNELHVASPGSASGSYEATIFSTITQTATCVNDGCSSINITLNSGTWDVFHDDSPNANQAAGTGFLDGVNILSGTWDTGNSSFSATSGVGGGFLTGTVTDTNNTFINPDLLGTTLQASLIFPGQSSPTYTRPAAFNGVATGPNTASSFVIQTDTSQDFTQQQVPEPSMMALVGIGLLGFGLASRRRRT
ncbi:PEP-CTERM protein-sorting domain-containing protein [Nitrosospira sp. Nl5]|uniref:flocculation-associated PEP-CTERM protein PepA n=1 Tax=Nitrosospira sp. Nl5 TaxID=200120 RepID=UPI0008839D7F|nr:flocculation-associated PEP-CTERM protein PepA [Nitrosospira sp. Nl5]SCY64996.1 PEP-CTERM protein-sorting domain-containing protein [Nitrosospira sp. Nl5]